MSQTSKTIQHDKILDTLMYVCDLWFTGAQNLYHRNQRAELHCTVCERLLETCCAAPVSASTYNLNACAEFMLTCQLHADSMPPSRVLALILAVAAEAHSNQPAGKHGKLFMWLQASYSQKTTLNMKCMLLTEFNAVTWYLLLICLPQALEGWLTT